MDPVIFLIMLAFTVVFVGGGGFTVHFAIKERLYFFVVFGVAEILVGIAVLLGGLR